MKREPGGLPRQMLSRSKQTMIKLSTSCCADQMCHSDLILMWPSKEGMERENGSEEKKLPKKNGLLLPGFFFLTTLKNKSLCSKSPDFPPSLVLSNKHPCVSADCYFFGRNKPGHTSSSRLSGLHPVEPPQHTQLLYAFKLHLHKCFFF